MGTLVVLGSGPALAQHVGCGETITKDTKLDNDLIGCPSTGIVIGANDITLDLNGHTVEGNYYVFGVAGIDNRLGYDGVTVEHGTIRQFRIAAFLNGDRDVLRKVDFLGPIEQGISIMGNHNRVVQTSVMAYFSGISIRGDANQVNDSEVNGIDGVGIGGTNNYVKHSHVVGRLGPGIWVYSGANVIKGNFATGGFFPSIWVRDAAGTRVEKNVATGSHTSGIQVGAGVIVTKNTAYDNEGYGIEADSDVIDGGGNRAFGNGNPLQCLNIVCK